MDNRTNIMQCAVELFSQRGYDAVGIQEVVTNAKVTKPTLYHYFGSKLGLLEALVAEEFSAFNDRISRAAVYEGDLTMTLRSVVETYFCFAREKRAFYRMQLSLWFAPPENEAHSVIARWNSEQYGFIEQLFVRAVKEHGNMKGRHQQYAATFIGVINTYVGLFLNGYSQLEDDLVVRAVSQFMHGILS